MCLSNSSLSNTMYQSLAHHHPTAVNNECNFFQGDDDMHDNDDSPTSNDVDCRRMMMNKTMMNSIGE